MQRYAISKGDLTGSGDGPEADALVRRSLELAAEGVEFLLLREKQLGERDMVRLTRRVLDATRDYGLRVLVAGRPVVARAANADGVHFAGSPAEARRAFREAWVSRSCHSVQEVAVASTAGVDLVLFGPVFGKTVDGVEVVPGIGLEVLREACEAAANSPVFALGGVTPENACACVAAGARGVAGIRMFFGR